MNKTFLFFTTILLACSTSKKMISESSHVAIDEISSFDVQGHRGCRGLMPENTWPAMRLALDLSVSTLEMDVVITKDKGVVLSHEPWFSHEITTQPDGSYISKEQEKQFNIYRMTYEEVKQYDVGLKSHPAFPKQHKTRAIKPLLGDVMDSVKQYMLTARRPFPMYNIEIKSRPSWDGVFHPEPAEYVEMVIGVIKAKAMDQKVIIQSFDLRPLQYLHQHYPHIKTALLIEKDDKRQMQEQLKMLGFMPSVYSPHFSLVTKELINNCHEKGMKIIPWTVNEKSTIDKLKALGVDGIITDYPNLALQ